MNHPRMAVRRTSPAEAPASVRLMFAGESREGLPKSTPTARHTQHRAKRPTESPAPLFNRMAPVTAKRQLSPASMRANLS